MNKQSNTYTLIYIIVLVVLVGAGLAFTSMALRGKQQENADADKMSQILAAVRLSPSSDSVIATYKERITDSYVVDIKGNKIENAPAAFDVNVAEQSKRPAAERLLPVYVCTLAQGDVKYVLPMYGAGLWGPIWGYISVDANGTTVYGAFFAHQGETPGLGAEIEKAAFSSQFDGKKLIKDGKFKPIAVVKGGVAPASGEDYVDGISGGTITSKGVGAMLDNCLSPYSAFLDNLRNQKPL